MNTVFMSINMNTTVNTALFFANSYNYIILSKIFLRLRTQDAIPQRFYLLYNTASVESYSHHIHEHGNLLNIELCGCEESCAI